MQTELSTAMFDSSINILVVLWFMSTWTILEIKGCTLAKYQYRDKVHRGYYDVATI